jgi:hypothetical protein
MVTWFGSTQTIHLSDSIVVNPCLMDVSGTPSCWSYSQKKGEMCEIMSKKRLKQQHLRHAENSSHFHEKVKGAHPTELDRRPYQPVVYTLDFQVGLSSFKASGISSKASLRGERKRPPMMPTTWSAQNAMADRAKSLKASYMPISEY